MEKNDIDNLIQKEIDGSISQEEAKQLETLAKDDPKVHRKLAEALWIHGQLLSQSVNLSDSELEKLTAKTHKKATSVIYIISSIAAAYLFFWLGSYLQLGHHKKQVNIKSVATLLKADNCEWGASELPTMPNSPLPPGKLNLIRGIATIQFTNGAELVMEAPSNIEILSNMHLRLIGGSVVMDIPKDAIGFTVETKEGNVVDYGTKFGVTLTDFDKPQVWVFDGEVEIQSNSKPDKPQRLFEGQSVSFGEKPQIVSEEANIGKMNYSKSGWTTLIPTKDNYIRQDYGPIPSNSPLLMVKYSSLAKGNVRLIYIEFDLSQHSLDHLKEAEFSLELQPSGKGFAAHIPDCEFSVYGLNQDKKNLWSENDLRFTNAPSYDSSIHKLDKSELTKLGSFQIDRGISSGSRSISTDSLVNYLKKHQGKLVTFIIERDNDEFDKQGLVNAFASKENPTAAPPRLHLKILE